MESSPTICGLSPVVVGGTSWRRPLRKNFCCLSVGATSGRPFCPLSRNATALPKGEPTTAAIYRPYDNGEMFVLK